MVRYVHYLLFVVGLIGFVHRVEGVESLKATTALSRPNILIVLTDDQGWGDLSLNGNKNLETPNIDALAATGAQFDRFFVCPVCSPTRAEFLTGRYHTRSGVFSTSAGGERLNLDELTIADTFKAAGYTTGAFGKWHNGMQYPYHPNGRGFDEYYGFTSGHWGNYFDPMLEHNGKIVRGEGFCVDDFTNKAISFMQRSVKSGTPFFAYLPLNVPHSPMQVPDRWWNKFKDKQLINHNRDPKREDVGHIRAALAMCENVDWNVGRLTAKLDELGIADNTIVVFFHDNGPNGSRFNGDMKGRKGSTDEGGVRSPLLVRWPQKIKPGTYVKQIGGAIDLLPTLAHLAGVPVISKKKLDGIDLSASLINSDKASKAIQDRLIFSHWNNRVSVRTQQFRLDTAGKLFDIKSDPGQRMDVSAMYPAETRRLTTAVASFRADAMADFTREDKRPFLIGHADAQWTQMPARDGIAHGEILRSNRFPNCSFYQNWKKTSDKVTWNVKVLEPGLYNVQVYYVLQKENVGCRVELTFKNNSCSKVVTKYHDPPLIGAAEDRVVRRESYVKRFIPFSLGTILLEAGVGELTLTVPEMPGDEGIEFRLLMFQRVLRAE